VRSLCLSAQSVPINIRIKIVLLMAKFESPIIVKGKMQVEFGIKMLDIDCTIDAFQGFCEMSIVVNRQQSERPSKIREEKIGEVYDNCENVLPSSVLVVATACFIP
jgi:hypothetical protein